MLLIWLQTDALRNMGRKLKYLSGYLNKNQSFHLKTILLTFKLEKKKKEQLGHIGLFDLLYLHWAYLYLHKAIFFLLELTLCFSSGPHSWV